MVATPSVHHQRPPFWRDAGVLKWVVQVATLALLVATLFFLATQAGQNLDDKDIDVSYDWLNNPANIQLGEGIDTVPSTAGRALWSGFVNTLRLATAGIFLATLLGVLVGLARLSSNWIAHKTASIFIETLRNIPVLVQIILWFAVLSSLGELSTDSGPIPGWFYVSQKGISLPRVFISDGFYQWLAVMVIVGAVAFFVRRTLVARQNELGGNQRAGLIPALILLGGAIIAWFVNPVMGWVGSIFDGLASVWDGIPQPVMQLALSVIAIAAAANFIRRFLNSRRTPAGLAKLIDDDYFRMIFAGVGALLAVVVVWVVWPGLSSWVINSGRDFFEMIAAKFGDMRPAESQGTAPFDAMRPGVTDGRFANFEDGGLTMTVFFGSVLIGLVLYTSTFIAEIVRGGVLAVPKGQTEAAAALGLSRSQSLRKVILPQAFRVIMPPLGNQYLNITKNTSLAIAVGMSDLVQVGQSVYNKNNQTLATFSMWMALFLACSLTISMVVNSINRRLAIVER